MMPRLRRDALGTSSQRTSPVRPTSPLALADLPTWESFPPADRHLLIGAIVQTARRQLPTRLAAAHGPARR